MKPNFSLFRLTGNKGNYIRLFKDMSHPETLGYTQENLNLLLNKYDLIYVKPVNGSYGHGQLKITKIGDSFSIRYPLVVINPVIESGLTIIEILSKVGDFITSYQNKSTFIVQQGIQNLLYKGREVDIRVYVYWTPDEGIKHVGSLVVAGGAYFGESLSLQDLAALYEIDFDTLEKKLLDITDKVAERVKSLTGYQLARSAYDFAIDKDFNVYLLEVNSNPSHKRFMDIIRSPGKHAPDLVNTAKVVLNRVHKNERAFRLQRNAF